MKSGYTKAYRKELESDIWQMPYLYHRVFYWLRQKAPWKSDVFPTQRKMNIYLNPGQLITSMGNIAEGVAYMENNVLKIPQRKTIQRILEWLNYHGMIALARHRQGTTIFILNWDTYQSKDEGACHSNDTTSDTDADTTSDTHLKKLKKLKNIKNKTNTNTGGKFQIPSLEEITEYCSERKNNVDPNKFINHYTSNGWMVGKTKMKDWQAAVRTWEGNNKNNGNGASSDEIDGWMKKIKEQEGFSD